MSIAVISSFILYMLLMLGIGLYFYTQTKNLSDFVLGGRGLGPGVTALSAGASDMSGWLLLGLPGMIFSTGANGLWIAVGLLIGAYLNWHYVAQKLRASTHALNNAITIPDYFANRFSTQNDASEITENGFKSSNINLLRAITAVVILVFYTLYTSSGLVGGAKLFEATFNLAYQDALLIGSLIIISYTFLGGYNAVSWTDFIQGILMLLALIVTPAVVIYELGGMSSTLAIVNAASPDHLNIFSGVSIISVLSLLAWGLGYFGQPHILVRFMSLKNVEDMPVAKKIGMSWMILSVIGSLTVGLFGYAYVLDSGIQVDDPEKIFIILTQLLFNPWIAGFLLAAILAAIMSTIDSQLLVSSSVLTRDIYQEVFRKNASDKELVWVGRGTVILIAAIALLLSMDNNSSVLQLVSYAWAGFGAAFGPLIILSLYSKNINKHGALAGIIVGSVSVIVWKNLSGGIFELYELLPSFIFAWLAIVITSKLTQKTATI